MTSKSVTRRSNPAFLMYVTLAAAAVGFFAAYIYHKVQAQRREARDDEDDNEEFNGMVNEQDLLHRVRDFIEHWAKFFQTLATNGDTSNRNESRKGTKESCL
ncbi:46201_t:CDS:1 [Gigaspora margarita]|uniref:46201_t:CDS:1 n=1 Tax=Gigaspora margarita TaxID=4874 RepID=A0ABN7UI45_GIGMA|nr:46201_t:CDS:1 [Gigaspora margarita]